MGGSLFGGSKTTPQDVTPPELEALRGPFAETVSQLFTGQGGPASLTGIPAYPGTLSAPLAPGEQNLLSALSADAGARTPLLNQTIGGQFLPGQPGANPFLEATIQAAQRPTLQGLEETLSRSLPGRFTQAGHFVQPQGSSPFDRAAAIATGQTAQALGDIASTISFGGYEAERGRQTQAIQLGQQEVQTMVTNLQAQALPRLIQEMGIERGLGEFQSRLQAVLNALQIASGAPLVNVGSQQETKQGIIPTLLSPFSFAR